MSNVCPISCPYLAYVIMIDYTYTHTHIHIIYIGVCNTVLTCKILVCRSNHFKIKLQHEVVECPSGADPGYRVA